MKGICSVLAAMLVSATGWAEPHKHRGPVTDIAFNPLSEEMYSCSQGGIFKGHGPTLERIYLPEFRVTSMIGGDGSLTLAGGAPGESGQVAVLDRATNELHGTKKISNDMIYSIAASSPRPFGFLALASGGIIEIGRFGTHHRHRHTAATRSVRVSPNDRFLASAGLDRVVIISEWKQPRTTITIQDHTAGIDCLAFSPDSTQIASGARDGKVRIHAVPGGKLIRTYSNLDGEISAIAWGGKQERLLAGTSKGKFYRLELSNDTAAELADWGDDALISALAISPLGKIFAGTLNRIEQVKSPN